MRLVLGREPSVPESLDVQRARQALIDHGTQSPMWIVKLSRKPVEGAGPGSAPRLAVVWE